ncbi:MAG: trigger factor family protein [Bacteroidales bacterium]|jgi:trigger factor|nr:trigger factor family protein [Bacteroidales bacterium]
MNIVNEKVTDLVQELKIEIFKEDYTQEVENELKKMRQKALVPGFRVGNVPMQMIKKMYYKSVLSEKIDGIISKQLYGYLKDNNLDIILEPLPVEAKSKIDLDQDENFIFTFEYALKSQFDINLDALPEVTYFSIKASQKEIDEYIASLRKQFGVFSTSEVIELEDDHLTVNYDDNIGYFYINTLNDKGKKLFIGKKQNDEVEVSLRTIFKEENSIAQFLKIDAAAIDPENPYTYTITIKSIDRITPAEINEEFFEKLHAETTITNEKELQQYAASMIEKHWVEETDKHFVNNAIATLIDNVTIELPDDFVKRYLLMTQKDFTQERIEKEYDDMKKSFKWQFIENKIAHENNINVTNEEVRDYVKEYFHKLYFAAYDINEMQDYLEKLVNDALAKKEDYNRIYDNLFDIKMGKVLKTILKVDNKSGEIEDFVAFLKGEDAPEDKKKKKNTTKKADETVTAESETADKPATAKKTTKKSTTKTE